MIRICIALFLVFAAHTAPAAETGNGFRGIPWGTALSELAEVAQEKIPVPKGVDSPVESFRRKAENLKLGEAHVDGISYNFLNGRLYSVTIDFSGYDSLRKVMHYCESFFEKRSGAMVKDMEYFSGFDSPSTAAILYYQFAKHTFFVRYGRLFIYSKKIDRTVR